MQLGKIFKNHMVIQRDKVFSIWGTGHEGEVISVTINHITKETATKDGKWLLTFPAMETKRCLTLYVQSNQDSITIEDIAVGEVWLAGGQSNMEFWMHYDENYKEALATCENLDIRFFDYPELSYEGQEEDYDYSEFAYWRVCNQKNLEYYSAVSYYFAQSLHQDLNMPIGIIGCNWGGTTASCWMDEKYLRLHGNVWLEEYQNGLKKINLDKYQKNFRKNPMNNTGKPFSNSFTNIMLPGISREEQLNFMENAPVGMEDYMIIGPCSPTRPAGLYHTMLKQIAPYEIRGVIWYQGESDEEHADIYADLLSDLIDCWRDLWREKLPFLCVQLAPFDAWLDSNGENFPAIRDAQEKVANQKEQVYLISSSDAGMQYDIHPKNKKPIGERLALSARGNVYRESILCNAPKAINGEYLHGDIILHFKHAQDGLEVRGKDIHALQIYGMKDTIKNKLPIDFHAVRIEEETIKIDVSQYDCYSQFIVSYAKTPYYEVNLYNKAGIPAVPFEIRIATK